MKEISLHSIYESPEMEMETAVSLEMLCQSGGNSDFQRDDDVNWFNE